MGSGRTSIPPEDKGTDGPIVFGNPPLRELVLPVGGFVGILLLRSSAPKPLAPNEAIQVIGVSIPAELRLLKRANLNGQNNKGKIKPVVDKRLRSWQQHQPPFSNGH